MGNGEICPWRRYRYILLYIIELFEIWYRKRNIQDILPGFLVKNRESVVVRVKRMKCEDYGFSICNYCKYNDERDRGGHHYGCIMHRFKSAFQSHIDNNKAHEVIRNYQGWYTEQYSKVIELHFHEYYDKLQSILMLRWSVYITIWHYARIVNTVIRSRKAVAFCVCLNVNTTLPRRVAHWRDTYLTAIIGIVNIIIHITEK